MWIRNTLYLSIQHFPRKIRFNGVREIYIICKLLNVDAVCPYNIAPELIKVTKCKLWGIALNM